MKLKIEKLIKREKDGKYGKYVSLSVLADGCWHNAVEKDWNKTWREGDTIDVERTKQGEYKGSPTYKIFEPGKAPIDPGAIMKQLSLILAILHRMNDRGKASHDGGGHGFDDSPPHPEDSDFNPETDEPEDLPF